jgi:hypothetical protein
MSNLSSESEADAVSRSVGLSVRKEVLWALTDAKTIRGATVHHPSDSTINTIFKRRININITINIYAQTIKRCTLAAAGRPRTDRCEVRRTLGCETRGKGKGKEMEVDGMPPTPIQRAGKRDINPPKRARFLFLFSFFRL